MLDKKKIINCLNKTNKPFIRTTIRADKKAFLEQILKMLNIFQTNVAPLLAYPIVKVVWSYLTLSLLYHLSVSPPQWLPEECFVPPPTC